MCQELNRNLVNLKILLQQEREYAKNLRVDDLQQTLRTKISLLSYIALFPSNAFDREQQSLLQEIARENRRNAKLFAYANEQVRQCIAFYFRSSPCLHYSNSGTISKRLTASQLLSGKV